MALLTAQQALKGFVPNFVAASAGGDTFVNDGRTIFIWQNNSLSTTISLPLQVTVDGSALPPKTVTGPGLGEFIMTDVFPTAYNNPIDNTVKATYSQVNGLNVAAIRLSRPQL
jgi:hypothetical protein